MATKKFTWTDETHVQIDVLDGPVAGTYQVDIEDRASIGGVITIGTKMINGKLESVKTYTDQITGYAEHYAASPTGLREQRRQLATEISIVLDRQQARRERAFNRDMGRIPQYDTPEYQAAVKALADFDAAHPEIKAAIEAEKQAGIERHMWD